VKSASDPFSAPSSGAAYGWGYGDDLIEGGAGADSLIGDGGLGFSYDQRSPEESSTYGYGFFGQDILDGGDGNDTLQGENDGDVYRFVTSSSAEDLGTDYIVESAQVVFNTRNTVFGRDKIDLSALHPDGTISLNLASASTQVVTTSQLSLLLSSDSGIEDVTGSDFGADSVTGNGLGNVLRGGSYNDTLTAGDGDDTLSGEAGNDSMIGGNGIDTADYAAAINQINVSVDGTANDSDGNGDTDNLATDIENVIGSAFSDTIVGNSSANVLRGGDGNDVLEGRNGNDTLWGDGGSDTLRGEDGADRLEANDGVADTLEGGPGNDTAITDGLDSFTQ
jgi:serralysin